jgi:hypothetical protein
VSTSASRRSPARRKWMPPCGLTDETMDPEPLPTPGQHRGPASGYGAAPHAAPVPAPRNHHAVTDSESGLPGADRAEGRRDDPEAFRAALERLTDKPASDRQTRPTAPREDGTETTHDLSPAAAYDRRREADHRVMTPNAITAREASAHAFSAPTGQSVAESVASPPAGATSHSATRTPAVVPAAGCVEHPARLQACGLR